MYFIYVLYMNYIRTYMYYIRTSYEGGLFLDSEDMN